jgi:hypothetical protein
MNIKIGTDVEFFLKDTDENLISAIGVVPGTKNKQHILSSGAGLHRDNVSLEIAFLPFDVFEDFNEHIVTTFEEVRQMFSPLLLSSRTSTNFPMEQLSAEEAWLIGCDPDFDAWTENIREIPSFEESTLRCNGAHVHIGIESIVERFTHHCPFVRYLDSTLGVWSVGVDKDVDRKKLYGTAGSFRPKPYGIEYRVLSNFWIFTESLRRDVFNLTQEAGRYYLSLEGKDIPKVPTDVRDFINGNKGE